MPTIDIIEGMALGSGIDLGGQIFGDGVIRTDSQEIPDTGGDTTDVAVTLVESQEDQDNALQLDTEVSAAVGLFGGSAKFNLSQQRLFHRFAITIVIHAAVRNVFRQMRDVQLTPTAIELLKNGQEQRFREQFGDMFVRGVHVDGEFYAILQIVCHDESDQASVRAQLRAGGILGSVNAGTEDSFASIVRKVTNGREVNLSQHQVGGDPKASLDPDELVTHGLDFITQVKSGKADAFTVFVVPYKTLDLPFQANFVDIESAKEDLAAIMQKRRDVLTRLAEFNFILGHPEQFDLSGVTNLNAIVGRFETAKARLDQAASRCVNRPLEAPAALPSVADLDIPTDDLPKRRNGATIPPGLETLRGNWVNNDAQAILSKLNVLPENDQHAVVTGTFKDAPSPVVAEGEWDDDAQTLGADLETRKGSSSGTIFLPAFFHSLQLRLKPDDANQLNVIDDAGPIIPVEPSTTFVFSFTRP